jgi:hypothetical protein
LETGILVGRRRRRNQVRNSIDHLEEENVETDSIHPVGFLLLREEDEWISCDVVVRGGRMCSSIERRKGRGGGGRGRGRSNDACKDHSVVM